MARDRSKCRPCYWLAGRSRTRKKLSLGEIFAWLDQATCAAPSAEAKDMEASSADREPDRGPAREHDTRPAADFLAEQDKPQPAAGWHAWICSGLEREAASGRAARRPYDGYSFENRSRIEPPPRKPDEAGRRVFGKDRGRDPALGHSPLPPPPPPPPPPPSPAPMPLQPHTPTSKHLDGRVQFANACGTNILTNASVHGATRRKDEWMHAAGPLWMNFVQCLLYCGHEHKCLSMSSFQCSSRILSSSSP